MRRQDKEGPSWENEQPGQRHRVVEGTPYLGTMGNLALPEPGCQGEGWAGPGGPPDQREGSGASKPVYFPFRFLQWLCGRWPNEDQLGLLYNMQIRAHEGLDPKPGEWLWDGEGVVYHRKTQEVTGCIWGQGGEGA